MNERREGERGHRRKAIAKHNNLGINWNPKHEEYVDKGRKTPNTWRLNGDYKVPTIMDIFSSKGMDFDEERKNFDLSHEDYLISR